MSERDDDKATLLLEPDETELARLLAEAGARPPLPEADLAAIRAAVDTHWSALGWTVRPEPWAAPRAMRRRRAPRVAGGLAAALLLALGVAYWLRPVPPAATVARVEAASGAVEVEAAGRTRPLAAGDEIPAGAWLRTADAARGAGRLALRLASGAALRLDVGSAARVEGGRLDLRAGAVYVASRGPASGIDVHTPLATVRELGTRYAVRLTGAEPALVVSVRAGAVAAVRDGRRHVARAGQALTIRSDGTVEARIASGWGPDWYWVTAAGPRFPLEGRTVRELLDWIAEETGWRIELGDDAARDAQGVVLHGDLGALGPDRAAFAVLPAAGLEAELRDGTLVVHAVR